MTTPPLPPTSVNTITDTETTANPRNVRIRLVPYTPIPNSAHMPQHTQSPSLRFPPIERLIPARVILKIGRFTDRQNPRSARSPLQDDIRFRSKVVSRHHAELWLGDDGSIYIRDTASSSGTFLNHVRLSPQNAASGAVKIKDGDTLQLGVEYRGGTEEVYRCVRMRVELDRPVDQCRTYRSNVLATITNRPAGSSPAGPSPAPATEACCICLLPLRKTPLLVTTCMHCFHFSCVRPLLRVTVRSPGTSRVVQEEADGFLCPLCRTYVDLNAEPPEEEDEDWTDGVEELSKKVENIVLNNPPTNTEDSPDPEPTPSNNEEYHQSTSSRQQQQQQVEQEEEAAATDQTDGSGVDGGPKDRDPHPGSSAGGAGRSSWWGTFTSRNNPGGNGEMPNHPNRWL